MEKREFSLLDILLLLRRRCWIVLLAAVFVAGIAGVYSWYSYNPTYSTSVQVIAVSSVSPDASAGDEYSQVNTALKEIKTYKEVLDSNDFMDVISKTYEAERPELWAEKKYTAAKLGKCFEYSITEDTYTFTVKVTTHSKESALALAEIFERLAPGWVAEFYEGDASIDICEHAIKPYAPSNSKNMPRNTIIGFLIGAILSFLILLIIDIADVRIKNEDDIIDNYPVPLLGSIPNFDSAKKKGYGYGKK